VGATCADGIVRGCGSQIECATRAWFVYDPLGGAEGFAMANWLWGADTGFGLIRMRRDLVEEYYARVTPSQDVSPVPGNPLAWYVRCGMQLPAITFRVAAGKEITIEGRRLYMRLVDSGKTGKCVGTLAAHKDSSPLTPFVLGYPGFMAYQFRFRFATVDDQAFQGMTIGWRKNPFEDMDDLRSEGF